MIAAALRATARRLLHDRSLDGDLTGRVPSAGGGELDQLARSFNQMADALDRARDELYTQNTDLEAARSLAQGAQLRAERADQAKNEYLSRMSHELRTPLNAIIGFGQLLESDDLKPHQQDDAKHIVAAGRHLLDLINEILDISRIEAGDLAISPEPVVLAERLRILVSDEGAGIAPDRIERLFVPFDRLGAEDSNVPGTGFRELIYPHTR